MAGNQLLTTPALTHITFSIHQKEIVIHCFANNQQFKMLDVFSQGIQQHPSYVAAFAEITIDSVNFQLTSARIEFVTVPHEKTKPKQQIFLMTDRVMRSEYAQQVGRDERTLSHALVGFHARSGLSRETDLSIKFIKIKHDLMKASDTETLLNILQRLKKRNLSQIARDAFVVNCMQDNELQQLPFKRRLALRHAACDLSPYKASLCDVGLAIYILQKEYYLARLSNLELQEIYQKYKHDLRFVLAAEEARIIRAVDETKRDAFLCHLLGYEEGESPDALGDALEVAIPERGRNLLELLVSEVNQQEIARPYAVPCKTQQDLKKLMVITNSDATIAEQIILNMLRLEKYNSPEVNVLSFIKEELTNDTSTLQFSDETADFLLSSSTIKSLTLREITEIAKKNKSGHSAEKLLSGCYWKFFHRGKFIWHPSDELGSNELKTLLIQHKNNGVASLILGGPKKKNILQRLFSWFTVDDDYRKRLSTDDVKDLMANHVEIKEEKINAVLTPTIKAQRLTEKNVLDALSKNSQLAQLLLNWKLQDDVNLVEEIVKSKLLAIVDKRLHQDKLTLEQLMLLIDLSLRDIVNMENRQHTLAVKMIKLVREQQSDAEGRKLLQEKTWESVTKLFQHPCNQALKLQFEEAMLDRMTRLDNTTLNAVALAKFVIKTNTYQATFIEKLEKLKSTQLDEFKEQHKDVVMQLSHVKFFKEQVERVNRLLGTEFKGERSAKEKAEFIH